MDATVNDISLMSHPCKSNHVTSLEWFRVHLSNRITFFFFGQARADRQTKKKLFMSQPTCGFVLAAKPPEGVVDEHFIPILSSYTLYLI